MKRNALKADLHVHSRYSSRPSQWFLQKIGCAESYTEPLTVYTIAMKRGMDLVTITDHNTLAGSLEIAHLENTFVSEEVTTYFPEDGCKLHVLAYNITERQHEDISRLRESVYKLSAYLHQERIVHALAHPMFSINGRLTIEHFEQMLLLFKNFELSGTRDDDLNNILCEILHNLTQQDIEYLANKHDLIPYDPAPWKKNLIGGSDDHSSVNIANTYTEVKGTSSVHEFLAGIAQNKARVGGRAFTPKAWAHTFYSIGYQFYKSQFRFGRYINKEVLLRFADRALIPLHDRRDGFFTHLRSFVGYRRPGLFFKSARATSRTMQSLFLKEARNIIWADPHMRQLLTQNSPDPQEMSELWFQFVNTLSEKVLKQSADSILEGLSGANVFDVFHSIGAAGSLYTMLGPYFVAYTLFAKDHRFCRQCSKSLFKNEETCSEERIKIAYFADAFYKATNLMGTLKKHGEPGQQHKLALTLITCGPEPRSAEIVNFSPIGTFEMPSDPDLKLYYPPLLKLLHYCYEQKFTHIHAVTPGPLGLTALAIARILKLPLYGTYPTILSQYVNQLSKSSSIKDLIWRYIIWFYNQMQIVYVPSRSTGDELVTRGLDKDNIAMYPCEIDIKRFHPSKRNGFFHNRFGIGANDLILLYVGHISKENNLPILVNTFKKLTIMREGLHLVVVGDGPYLAAMKEALKGLPATFTRFLDDDELAQAYASSDLFISPSSTDSGENGIFEAQASGIPVIVTDAGDPPKRLIYDITGIVVPANNPDALIDAVILLTDNPERLQKMKQDARKYMENRSFESPKNFINLT